MKEKGSRQKDTMSEDSKGGKWGSPAAERRGRLAAKGGKKVRGEVLKPRRDLIGRKGRTPADLKNSANRTKGERKEQRGIANRSRVKVAYKRIIGKG